MITTMAIRLCYYKYFQVNSYTQSLNVVYFKCPCNRVCLSGKRGGGWHSQP